MSSFGDSSTQTLCFASRQTFGATFSELTSIWWENLTVNSGIRADSTQGFQPTISPRIRASFQLSPLLQIRGGYGQGFKLPSLSSRDDPLIGNLDLNPETSFGWDLGLHFHSPGKKYTATIEYFYNLRSTNWPYHRS